MSFDRNKAQVTETQMVVAEAADLIYELVKAQLEDEDPGEIDWDDILEIALGSTMLLPRIQQLIQAIGSSGGGIKLGVLLAGAGAAFLNDNIDEVAPAAEGDMSDQAGPDAVEGDQEVPGPTPE